MLLAEDWNLQQSMKRFQNNTLEAQPFSSMSKHGKHRSFRDGTRSIMHQDSSLSRDSSKKLDETPIHSQFKTSSKAALPPLEAIGENAKGKTAQKQNESNLQKSIKAEGRSIAPTVPVTAFSSQLQSPKIIAQIAGSSDSDSKVDVKSKQSSKAIPSQKRSSKRIKTGSFVQENQNAEDVVKNEKSAEQKHRVRPSHKIKLPKVQML